MTILLRHGPNDKWRQPEHVAFADEHSLELLLSESPDLLPGVAAPVAAANQVEIPGSGPLDILLIDAAGTLTVVECKLQVNPDIRRTVVGQAFAYASGLAEMTYDDLDRAWFRRRSRSLTAEFADRQPADWSEEGFRAKVASSLASGAIRILIVVDGMTHELKRTITYINRHSSGDYRLFGLELRRLADGDVQLLMPTLYGEESGQEAGVVSTDAKGSAYFRFWSELRRLVAEEHSAWSTNATPYRDNWTEFRGPVAGTAIWLVFKGNRRLALELVTNGSDETANRSIYTSLKSYDADLRQGYPDLEWDDREGKQWQRLRIHGPEAAIVEEEAWQIYREWFLAATEFVWTTFLKAPSVSDRL